MLGMGLADITAAQVEQALKEYDRLGGEAFLRRYGFGPARRYLLVRDGREYDSKAVVGAAHGFLPGRAPLAARSFSGGEAHAVGLLRRLGFTVVDRREPELTAEALAARLRGLTVRRGPDGPALYQPLVLLWAVGRARRGEQRLVEWSEAEQALRGLLARHGMRGERPRPDYPVLALHGAGLWELAGHTEPVPTAHGDSALRRWFDANRPRGGLTAPAHELVRRSGEARLTVLEALLDTYFTGLDTTALLADVGLGDPELADDHEPAAVPAAPPQVDPVVLAAQYDRWCAAAERRPGGRRAERVSRDPLRSAAARRAVLLRSGGRCENPSCAGQPRDVTRSGVPILEVDHVDDLARGGPDHPRGMVALCPNCHAVKTRGRTGELLRAVLRRVAEEEHERLVAARRGRDASEGAAPE
jgi:5-methylcytosine-specific restriction protein A